MTKMVPIPEAVGLTGEAPHSCECKSWYKADFPDELTEGLRILKTLFSLHKTSHRHVT